MNRAQEEINAAGARLVFIGQATPRHAAHFQRRYAPDVEILADEDRASYKGMGLRRASVGQLLGPRSVMKGLTRTVTDGSLTVQGRIIGDAAQLGGTFIVLPTGEIAWSHLSKDASDNAELPELLEALTDALA